MNQELHHQIMYLFAGLSLFMYGLSKCSDYLQRLAGNHIRILLSAIKERHWLAILVGVLLTVLLQSSGAVTALLVGMGSAHVIRLSQVMGVIIGAAIGSTITIQLISFNVAQYGLFIFVVGFTSYFLSKKNLNKNIFGVIMMFGLVFWGLEMMQFGTQAVKSSTMLLDLFKQMKENPLMSVLATGFFTAFVHSSAVTIGLAMSLASSGIISLEESIYWIYGANIGTTSTALMAAMGAKSIGRQVAWAHFGFKVGSVIVFYPLTSFFSEFMLEYMASTATREIANANTILNVISAILFYPLIDKGAVFFEKMIPKSASEKEFGPEFITQDFYSNSAVAIERARREALRTGDIVHSMFKDVFKVIEAENFDLVESIKRRDDQVDLLNREIKMFLVKFTSEAGHLSKPVFHLVSFVSDLENIADIVDKGLLALAKKKHALKLEFSEEGQKELAHFHHEVLTVLELSLSAFHSADPELAQQIAQEKVRLSHLHEELIAKHYDRLTRGVQETINTSSIHLEVLGEMRRTVGLACKQSHFSNGRDRTA